MRLVTVFPLHSPAFPNALVNHWYVNDCIIKLWRWRKNFAPPTPPSLLHIVEERNTIVHSWGNALLHVNNDCQLVRTKLYCFLSAFKTLGWINFQHTRIDVALARWNFLLFFCQKTIKNSHVPKRQLYAICCKWIDPFFAGLHKFVINFVSESGKYYFFGECSTG